MEIIQINRPVAVMKWDIYYKPLQWFRERFGVCLACWFSLTFSESCSKVKIMGQS